MMVRQPEPPNNPFGKLLDMGFSQAVAPAPPPAKKKTVSATPQVAVRAKPNPKSKRAVKKKAKKTKKASVAQSFRTSLPNARSLTAAGTKKAPPYREEKRKNAKPNESYDAKRSVKPEPPRLVIRVDPLIEALPERTMQQLQGQWLNCLRLLEDPNEGKRQAARKFRDEILAEWERRCKRALSNPDYFDWPSTQAGPADRSQRFETWNPEGVLKYMGYEVGKTKGLADNSRREILNAVFGAVLPPVNSPGYIKKWGLPGTASRLERLANELARFARNGKRNRTADYSAAVADWEADLSYLYRRYYVGKFGFGWPRVA